MKNERHAIQAIAAGRGIEALRLVGYDAKEAKAVLERLESEGLVRSQALTRKGRRLADELGPLLRR